MCIQVSVDFLKFVSREKNEKYLDRKYHTKPDEEKLK